MIVVDDERLAINSLMKTLAQLDPDGELYGFHTAAGALDFLEEHIADVAFLDIEMPGMSGLELATHIRLLRPETNIIFVTGYSEYALEAHGLYVTGYLLKPASKEKVRLALEHLRNPVPRSPARIRAQTFGNFEFFVDGAPLRFGRAKAKELLAYLIDRKGASASLAEIAAVLWEDKPYTRSLQNQVQTVVSEMMKSLKEAGVGEIILKRRNSLAVNIKELDCDYYAFMRGSTQAVNAFMGEYMSNYSWAEFTVGALIEQSEKNRTVSAVPD